MFFESLQLKVCEGCGSLWVRPALAAEVYCAGCVVKLARFPRAGAEMRPGRKRQPGVQLMAGAR